MNQNERTNFKRREINFLSNLIEHCDTSDAAQYDPDFRVDQV